MENLVSNELSKTLINHINVKIKDKDYTNIYKFIKNDTTETEMLKLKKGLINQIISLLDNEVVNSLQIKINNDVDKIFEQNNEENNFFQMVNKLNELSKFKNESLCISQTNLFKLIDIFLSDLIYSKVDKLSHEERIKLMVEQIPIVMKEYNFANFDIFNKALIDRYMENSKLDLDNKINYYRGSQKEVKEIKQTYDK